jgi:hypothetical protein
MIGTAFHARSGGGCGEREPLSTLALGHNMLRMPLVDLAKRHVLNLVARLDALDYLASQLSSSPFSFSHPRTGTITIRHDYKGSAVIFMCVVIPSVLEYEKSLVPIQKWGKGKED